MLVRAFLKQVGGGGARGVVIAVSLVLQDTDTSSSPAQGQPISSEQKMGTEMEGEKKKERRQN